jgi:hypothetical protein
MGPRDCRIEQFIDRQGRVDHCKGRVDPETSPSDLQCPDLYFWRVSEHLDASFSRAELSRASVIQWGAPFRGGFHIYKD